MIPYKEESNENKPYLNKVHYLIEVSKISINHIYMDFKCSELHKFFLSPGSLAIKQMKSTCSETKFYLHGCGKQPQENFSEAPTGEKLP